MKKNMILCSTLLLFASLNNGCKKDSDESKTKTFKEEFVDVFNLTSTGWSFKDNSAPYAATGWTQGFTGTDKSGATGFAAYSYRKDEDEYAYIGYRAYSTEPKVISVWMISPIYEIKNGDKISFYTRAAEGSGFADRLQLRLNESDNTTDVGTTSTSVGKFTILLKDVNENASVDGYPKTWTKYEVTIGGLSAAQQSRIAFRYFVDGNKSNAIGVDAFSLTSY